MGTGVFNPFCGPCCGGTCYAPCPLPATQMQVTISGVSNAGGCSSCATIWNRTWLASRNTGGSLCLWNAQISPIDFCVFPSPGMSVFSGTIAVSPYITDVYFGLGMGPWIARYASSILCAPTSGNSITLPYISATDLTTCPNGWPASITLTGV